MTTDGVYNFNGVDLLLQPSSAGWKDRKILGYDGYNIPIYEPTYSFGISWDVQRPEEFYQLWSFWKATSAAGSISVWIPAKRASTYTFALYTGCVVDEPTMKEYFAKHLLKVEMMIRSITVDLS